MRWLEWSLWEDGRHLDTGGVGRPGGELRQLRERERERLEPLKSLRLQKGRYDSLNLILGCQYVIEATISYHPIGASDPCRVVVI